MKIAFISDIHGNLLALERCLTSIVESGCGKIYCLGDTFGYFPDSRLCFDLLQKFEVDSLMGNHEAMLLGILPIQKKLDTVYQLSAVKQYLPQQTKNSLMALLPFKIVELQNGLQLLLVHGSPWNPLEGYVYPDSDLSLFSSLPFNYVIMGHTHHPYIHHDPNLSLVNLGSCGLPRDSENTSSFAIYDTISNQMELVSIPLDLKETQKRYPDVHPSVLECLQR